MNYSEFVQSRVKWFPTVQENLLHATIGLIGEVVELSFYVDAGNFIEEHGDLEFYLQHLNLTINTNNIAVKPTEVNRIEAQALEKDPMGKILFHTGELLDLAKKAWVYNKPVESLDWNHHTVRVNLCLHFLATSHGFTQDASREANMAKLRKRYPDGYSDAAAQARADKTSLLS